jgi:hypothetical protein
MRTPMIRSRFFSCMPLASHSVRPVGVRQHVEAHQSKDNEHNHGTHDPHDTHFGFLTGTSDATSIAVEHGMRITIPMVRF